MSGRLFHVTRASSPPLPSPAWCTWSFLEENQRLHGHRYLFLFPLSGRLSVFPMFLFRFPLFSAPFLFFLLSFSLFLVSFCGPWCFFSLSLSLSSSWVPLFPLSSPCLSQVIPANSQGTKKGYLGYGGVRWDGFVRVASIFCSRLPHTCVTVGIVLEKVLVWYVLV